MKKANKIEIDKSWVQQLIDLTIPENKTYSIEKVEHNFSTIVFKISGKETNWLRIAVDKKENFTPEVILLKKLIEKEVKVPEILFFENFSPKLNGHSFMLISDIKGDQMNKDITKETLQEAGKELAKINSLRFDKFGMIERFDNNITEIKGSKKNHVNFILDSYKEKLLKISENNFITSDELNQIRNFIEQNKSLLNIDQGNLVHGDFNLNHIFQENGHLSGIIDFGDAKISNQFYDLAYFKICHRNHFEDLFGGFKQTITLPESWENIMKITTLAVGIRIIASDIEDINFIDLRILKEKASSFKKELEIL